MKNTDSRPWLPLDRIFRVQSHSICDLQHCVSICMHCLLCLYITIILAENLAILEKWVPYSQRYLFNAIPDTNHNANPSNPNTRYICE